MIISYKMGDYVHNLNSFVQKASSQAYQEKEAVIKVLSDKCGRFVDRFVTDLRAQHQTLLKLINLEDRELGMANLMGQAKQKFDQLINLRRIIEDLQLSGHLTLLDFMMGLAPETYREQNEIEFEQLKAKPDKPYIQHRQDPDNFFKMDMYPRRSQAQLNRLPQQKKEQPAPPALPSAGTVTYFPQQDAAAQRQEQKQSAGMNCIVCNKFLKNSTQARIHLRMTHGREENLYCPHCGVSIRVAFDLARHILSEHKDKNSQTRKPRYTCPQTGVTYTCTSKLAQKIAQDKRFLSKPLQLITIKWPIQNENWKDL